MFYKINIPANRILVDTQNTLQDRWSDLYKHNNNYK